MGTIMEPKKTLSQDMRTKSDALGQREEEGEQKPRESVTSATREGVLNARKRRREDDYQSRCKYGARERGREDGALYFMFD